MNGTSPDAAARLPEIDELEVLILVDNVTDLVSSVPEDVEQETESLLRAGMEELAGEHLCCAHFGLSLVLTARRGDERRTVLFDGGPEGYAVERNGARLGLDFGTIGGVVLSHGHWDHAGGLGRALELIRESNGGREVPFHLHPGMFRRRGIQHGDHVLPFRRILDPGELAARGARPVVTDRADLAEDLFYVSGEIPRLTSYERGLPGHVAEREDGTWEEDRWILDERFLAVRLKDRGIAVFTACSHAGVVNVLEEARRSFPDLPLHTVFGGFHLSGEEIEPIISDTVLDLKRFGLARIVPCHCTGWRAVSALHAAFGDRVVVPGAVGRRFRF